MNQLHLYSEESPTKEGVSSQKIENSASTKASTIKLDIAVQYREKPHSPFTAALYSLIPLWSGSFTPYKDYTKLEKLPPAGLAFAAGKSLSFLSGAAFFFMNIHKKGDADDHHFLGEYSKERNAREDADNYKDKALISYLIWGSITIVDIIYSAWSVNKFNNKIASLDPADKGCTLSLHIMPVQYGKNFQTPAGVSIALTRKW